MLMCSENTGLDDTRSSSGIGKDSDKHTCEELK